jgi:hypothetical protein
MARTWELKSGRTGLLSGSQTAGARGRGPHRPRQCGRRRCVVLRAVCGLDHGDHVVAVISHECEVRFDVGQQHSRAGWLGEDPRAYERLGPFGRLVDDLLDEVVLAGEVVADQAAADPQLPGYAGEGRSRKAGLGDGVDRRGHDLHPPGGLDEGPLRARTVCQWAVPAPARPRPVAAPRRSRAVSRWPRRSGVAVARTRRRRPTGRGGRCLARGWW